MAMSENPAISRKPEEILKCQRDGEGENLLGLFKAVL